MDLIYTRLKEILDNDQIRCVTEVRLCLHHFLAAMITTTRL